MQTQTIRKGFECKFEPFERDSNANSNHSKRIRSILIPFEVFKCEFEPFDGCKHSNSNSKHSNANSKHSNAYSNHSKGIRSVRIQILTTQKESKHSKENWNHSKGIGSIRKQIRTIRKGFEAFECQFDRDSKRLNATSNHSKGI